MKELGKEGEDERMKERLAFHMRKMREYIGSAL